MAITIKHEPIATVKCDECQEQEYSILTDDANAAKRQGLKMGWEEVIHKDGDHGNFCPNCALKLGLDEIR